MKATLDLTSTSDFCRNFPRRPKRLIPRDNLYEHVDTVFKDVSRVIYLEGAELTGKTEFLAGYMQRYPVSTIGVFLAPGDAYFYTPEYLMLVIAEQIHWITEGTAGNFDSVDQQTFQKLLNKLQKISRQSPITFVIDGLAEPTSADHSLLGEMLGALPFSQTEFRFIISGSSTLFGELKLDKYKPKENSLIPIGSEEAAAYFQDIQSLTPKDISDIRQFCKGAVGLLVKFRSLLDTGSTLEQIFSDKSGGLSDLLEMEWGLDSSVAGLQGLLAYVAFSNRLLTVQQLVSLSSQSLELVRGCLNSCRFVEIGADSDVVSIRSAGEKNFLRRKLALHERSVQEKFVKELLKDPDGVDATRYLPAQLMTVGHYDDLIQRLNNDHFVKLLESERSLGALKRHSDIGWIASTKSGDESARFRFGLSSSTVSGLALSAGTRSKIEALVKLGGAEGAIELASLSPTSEERLKLLGATARALHGNQLPISSELKRQIKQLVDEVDVKALGLMATDIACDILVVDYGLAVAMFQKAQNRLDKSRSESGLASDKVNGELNENEKEKEQALGEVHIKPNERHSIRFANAISTLVERMPVIRILTGGGDLEPRHELLMLKQWIKKRKRDPEAWKVADRALDVALKDLSRAPRLEDFRSIAVVLPYIDDIQIADRLVKRIEAQLGTHLMLGTTAESVRLEMLLERVRYRISPAESELDLINIYAKVEQIKDISVKTACFAWILYSLQLFPDPTGLESRTTLISETTTKLVDSIELLLKSSADHFQAAKGAIHALARVNTDLAFELISQLNSKNRRDMGYAVLAQELVSARAYGPSVGALLRCFSAIKSEHQRSVTILGCLKEIANDVEMNPLVACHSGLLELWKSIRVANYRFVATTYSYRILVSTKKDTERESELRAALSEIWPQIMVDWVRTDLGYMLVRDISKVNMDFSREWLGQVLGDQKVSQAPSESLSQVLHLTVSLVVRCYSAVAPVDCESHDAEFSRVANLINSIPVPEKRIGLWCDLGIKLHYLNKHGLSKRICLQQVQSILDGDFSGNEFVRENLIVAAAPLLYLNHPATISHLISKIKGTALQDQARRDICDVILRKTPLSEPFRSSDVGEYDMDQNDAAALLDILQTMEEDGHIFSVLKNICSSLTAKRNESRIRRTQVRDYLNTLRELVNSKFPFPENIKHDGYKIAATAYILRATATLISVSNSQWKTLFDQASAIPNVADRVVVIAIVASCAKGRASSIYPNWFSEIRNDLTLIPTSLDRIDRYQWIAEMLGHFDKPHATILLREGITLTSNTDEEDSISDKQRKMLDIAYNIDPDLVDKLIDISDNDKASTVRREEYTQRKRLKDIQKSIANDPDDPELSELSPDEISDICFKNLGSLNAGRIPFKPLVGFDKLSLIASGLSMPIAYSMWSWLAQNAIRKSGGNSRNDSVVRQLFEATSNAGELVLALIGKTRSAFETSSVSLNGLVKPGDREAVFAKICAWAKENNGKEIRLSDPFFGTDDLEVIYRISEAAPDAKISVLTSKKHVREKVSNSNSEDAFHAAWAELYDVTPPDVEIGIVGLGNDGGHPIHDRWIVAADSGLRLGTSANSIGYLRMSEISDMDSTTSHAKFDVIGEILQRDLRMWDGIKLQLSTFYLH